MKYTITMNNGDIRTMVIVSDAATVEGEIAKWHDANNVTSWVKVA